MSDLNIRMNLETSAAEAKAAEVKDDLAKLRTDAEKPVKINVDASKLDAATGGAGKLREALGNVQAAALGELSQKAGQLGASLGGVAGSVAEVAIKSAAAFGPIGIAITAVLAGLALLKQAYDEDVAATERVDTINRTLAGSSQQLGDAYGSIADAANRAKTAEEARNIVGQRTATILAEQLNLLASGGTLATAQGLSSNFDNIARASMDATTGVARYTSEQVKNIALTGNAQQQLLLFGTTMEHSTNAIDNQTRALIVSSTAIVQRITLENQSRQMALVVAEALRAAEQRKSTADESSSETAERLAAADLEVALASDNARTSAANLTVANLTLSGATAQLAEHTVHLTDAEKTVANQRQANEALEARKRARMAATTSETAAQTRAGIEALRVAEQGLLTAGQEISVSEQQTRAEQALAFAVGETTRARAASARGGQTTAERTALVGALNAEATARQGVAEALERQANAQRDLKSNQIDIEAKEQTESNRAFAEWAGNRNTTNQERLTEEARVYREFAENQNRENEKINAEEAARANEVKSRNDQLAGSAGKLGEAQIAAAFAAAAAGENAGVAMQAALKASLLALAQESAIKALYATATGLFQLATLNPAAATTLTSAAMFAGVAVAAGIGAAVIPSAAAAPTGAGGGSAAMAGPAGATPMRSGGADAGEAPKNITINFSAFQSNEQAQALIVRSLREAGYNGRARVGSSFSAERR